MSILDEQNKNLAQTGDPWREQVTHEKSTETQMATSKEEGTKENKRKTPEKI